jgi:hypothetical protein
MIFKICFWMDKHKQYAFILGPLPQGQAAVREAAVLQQIHSIMSQSERRLDMGFQLRWG